MGALHELDKHGRKIKYKGMMSCNIFMNIRVFYSTYIFGGYTRTHVDVKSSLITASGLETLVDYGF
jgi:hypothetical protein